jgi:serine/threonine-protein kinase RsbW
MALMERTLTIKSRTEQLMSVRDFVSGAAREFGFGEEDVSKIALAVDEACTNVIKHAYRYDGTQTLTVTITAGSGGFEVRIHDQGAAFNPDEVPTPDMKEYLSHYRKGGLGVYLMRKLMDRVEYRPHHGRMNEVLLVKYLRP